MMEDKLQEELTAKYRGKKVKDDCTDWDSLENEELLYKTSTEIEDEEAEETEEDYDYDDDLELIETMSIHIDLDENDCISDVWIGFQTLCYGDSGIGEEDPEDYWSYEECFAAAEEFIQNILEQKNG